MANLYFPQLTSGAVAPFPIHKARYTRTVKNLLADGSIILFPDPGAERLVWELAYTELSAVDLAALQAHFELCGGPLRRFTFIDPTDNMLTSSSDLLTSAWQLPSFIQIAGGQPDPTGDTQALTITNTSQTSQQLSQSFSVPANYQYCFSVYAVSAASAELVLIRRGLAIEERTTFQIGPNWSRLVSSGRLNDGSMEFTIAVELAAGQQVGLYGLQVEPQVAPSRYRVTGSTGGVYATVHWLGNEFVFASDAPNLFSTSFSIEATI